MTDEGAAIILGPGERPTFAATASDGFRAYTKESLVRHDDDDDTDHDEQESDDAWESTEDGDDAAEISFDVRRAAESRADRDDDEFEE